MWITFQNLRLGPPGGQQIEQKLDPDARTFNARLAEQCVGIGHDVVVPVYGMPRGVDIYETS